MKFTKSGHQLVVILVIMLFLQCATSNEVSYNIPITISKENREKLITILDRGKELYKTNCSECHGIFTKGKDKVPNFTNQQIDNYSARFIRRDPKNHAILAKMSPEQLNDVLTFLRYKNPKNTDSAFVKRRR